jgi:hypothetical protein
MKDGSWQVLLSNRRYEIAFEDRLAFGHDNTT